MNSDKDQNNEENIDIEKINPEEVSMNEKSIEVEEKYKFGWSSYSEITNGRFAMIGLISIILIELFSQKSFLSWAGII